ncbi:diaminobutyrate--2-oxoglutarate transaminase [Yoonia sediminilitoris]|uniref:Diaminobutyrate--2-oxoglutarate transaminase n=1 Tax=Yoonia sediminilitoris TaxID=1286148 RepID=A0A2T6KLL3_9RHOB|nr:diaminobutyrate--2-oxoglutarate transaminase [Yoonia sediminilitoris]PUB17105.1 diaminobutyrate aminotransferase [Yoonia sediminilitoris]RCW97400.1 diaminobutyrate aminotransferase [Yoonia sediminilitoris]
MFEINPAAFNSREDVFARLESRVQSYANAFPETFGKSIGTEMFGTDGTRYLDFLAGAGSLNYGHNNPVFKKALLSYIKKDGITHSLDLHTAAKAEFLEAFGDIILAPRQLDYLLQFTGPTGTNAVEAALKIARKVKGRSNVISFTNGFHGVSLGALSLTGNKFLRKAAGVTLQGVTQMPYDGYLGEEVDTIAVIDQMLSDPSSGIDHPAAMIVEVVQGEGGLNAARDDWLRGLRRLCTAHDILLIVDDIQAGCGRTGHFFSFEGAGITPDIVTLSKSLSGSGLPFSVVLLKPELDIWEPGEHNGTFRGNNHAFVTATAALKTYWKTPDFAREVCAKGAHLGQRLQDIVDQFAPELVRVKGRGMMRGIACADPEVATAISVAAFKRGLIIERAGPLGEVVKCLMPLTTSNAQLDEGLDILCRSVEDALRRKQRPVPVSRAPKSVPSG